jgi:hypothetical protein
MPRISLPEPPNMSADQRAVYDRIVNGPRGKIQGPLRAALHNAELADKWNTDDIESVKANRCGNCAAFDVTSNMLDCIAQGIGSEPGSDPHDTVDAGQLGYCKFLKFKCASKRTCDAWVEGGPVTDKD